MREGWLIAVGCVVCFFALLAYLARGVGETTAAVGEQTRIGQLEAEVAGARAESETLRAELKKSREDLGRAQKAGEDLKRKVAELEKQAGQKAR